jgi:penicillin-binding protein 1C
MSGTREEPMPAAEPKGSSRKRWWNRLPPICENLRHLWSNVSPRLPGRRLLRRTAGAIGASLPLFLAGWLALPFVPLPPALLAGQPAEWEFVDRTGQPLRAFTPDKSAFRHPVEYGEVPHDLVDATLAAEDRRFFQHPGVDWRATLRAAWQWALHRRVISGGSTITQQLIKLAQPRPRTLRAKIIEAAQALRLEQVWDKQKILAAYLNRLDYGNFNRGCAAAAGFYFAKPLRDLSPAECALLAALPQAPSRLNPHAHFDRARKRQRWILGQMRQAGWLTDEQARRAVAEPLRLAAPRRVFEAPHFVDLLLAARQGETGRGLFPSSTLLRTTLDLDLNRFSEEVLRRHLSQLRPERVSNGAVVVLDNHTGGVLALVGSENYFAPASGQVNGAWASRSTGSALKPFTYLLAFERGATPATVVADVPTDFATATGLFTPVNYDRHCYGPARYRVALANSLNISAVKTLASIGGPEPLRRLLQKCGLTTLGHPAEEFGLGLTIGNAEARLLELANAYACLARLGIYKPYYLVLVAAERSLSAPLRIADPSAAFLIADILSDNDARLSAFGAESPLRFDFPVACKTGTSSDFRDNWAFGYTPEFTVGVWVGNFDGSPMRRISGVTGAAPILHELFERLHERYGTTWYPTPSNIVERWVHPITGKLLSQTDPPSAPNSIKEKFLDSNLPPLESPEDYADDPAMLGFKSSEPRPRASNSSRPPTVRLTPVFAPLRLCVKTVRLGPEYRDWLASGDNWLGDLAVLAPAQSSLRIIFPLPGTIFYLDPDLPGQGRRVRLRAEEAENPQWRSDSLQLVRQEDGQVALLTEGRHRITVRDPLTGAQAETWIEARTR